MSENAQREALAPRYILLSDVHLGSDLVQHARPWSRGTWLREQAEVDHRLTTMLTHYTEQGERPTRFVLVGDFVDFIGMSIAPPEGAVLRSSLTDEEREHGLGSAADHSAYKVRAVAERHPSVFAALAQALISGHALDIVRGNHDVEWHWGSAQKAFVDALCAFATSKEERARIRSSVDFHPWFYYVPGLLYVEHGHEFDPMCSYGDPLLPVCLSDAKRIRWTPSDVLLRYVARPTPGLSTVGHERADFRTYLRVATSFGLKGGFRLGKRFFGAALRLVRGVFMYRAHRERIERGSFHRLRALSRKHRIAHELLTIFRRLHARPVAQSLHAVLRSLFLDRVALITLVALTATLALLIGSSKEALSISVATTLCAGLLGVLSGRGRDLDPAARMRTAAGSIARALDVRYVVMGHTHEPRFDALDGGGTYVNLGFWGEDDLPEDRIDRAGPPCSYLALTPSGDGYEGALLAWDPVRGPLAFDPTVSPERISVAPKPMSAPLRPVVRV